jgi:glutamine amidotransferase
MIALVDYGIGNLRSVEKALAAVGAQVSLTADPDVILQAEKVVLPGVGAFGDGMNGLAARGLIEVLERLVDRGTPLLGICLGMQLLFESSAERGPRARTAFGAHRGLAFLPGSVRRFDRARLKVPQTGWNQLQPLRESPLLRGVASGSYAYFNHSFYCEPSEPGDMLALTEYGIPYASVVEHGRLYGVQFHPEKSQAVGLDILRNFVEAC